MRSAKIIGPVAAVTAVGLIAWLCYSKGSVGIARPSHAVPRYDVQSRFAPFAGTQPIKYRLTFQNKKGLIKTVEDLNPISVSRAYSLFERSYTTDRNLMAMGRAMHMYSSGTGFQFTFLRAGRFDDVWIDTYDQNLTLYGQECSDMIEDAVHAADKAN